MSPEEILTYCLTSLEGTVRAESWGESGVFYNPGGVRKRGVYVLTVKEKDGANDKASQLDRPGICRVSLGLRRETYARLFGPPPARPPKGAWWSWISISPRRTGFCPTRFTPGWGGSGC